MNKRIIQASFERGMIENMKQNELFQEGVASSVLWLENYNPNLEYRSAVKRFGVTLFRDNGFDDLIAGLKKYDNWNLSKFTEILFNDPNANKESMVLHSTIFEVTEPDYNKTHLLFVKRFPGSPGEDFLPDGYDVGTQRVEATGLVAYVYEYDLNNNTLKRDFYEPHSYNHSGQVVPPSLTNLLLFPGYYVFGTFRDCCRYGENILFVTQFDNKELYNELVKEYMFPCYVWYRWDITKRRKDGDDRYWNGITFNNLTTDKGQYSLNKVKVPSMKMFRENSFGLSYIDVISGDLINNDTGLPGVKDVSLIMWETDLYHSNYFNDQLVDLSDPLMPEVITAEAPNNRDLINDYIAQTSLWTNQPQLSKFTDSSGETYTTFYYDTIIGSQNANFYFRVIPSAFPDYIKAKLPRCWFLKEKIPIVLTAKVSNIEIIVYKGTYTLQDGETLHPPPETNIADYVNAAKYDGQNGLILGIYQDNWRGKKRYLAPLVLWDEIWGYGTSDNMERRNNVSGYCESYGVGGKVTEYVTINFAIRLTEQGKNLLIDNDVSSIKLYVSKPSETEQLLRSVGNPGLNPPPPILYAYPKVDYDNYEDIDYSNYALVKEFLITGKGTHVRDITKWEGMYAISSNAWQEVDGDLNGTNPSGDPWAIQGTKTYWSAPQLDDYENFPVKYPNTKTIYPRLIKEEALLNNARLQSYPVTGLTPDFILWDYPADRPPLNLQASGKYWEGLGAGLICVVKSRTFISQCIDENGKEEQAISRFSAVQSGIASPDIFNKEDKIRIGHLSHTALIEFREQIVWFNRETSYRMTLPNIFDVSTWEILETIQGQGTFSQKTICVTPHGICFCNENGIWITDGGMPFSLTGSLQKGLAITSLYQKIAMDKPYIYIEYNDVGTIYIGNKGYNEYMELLYNEYNDELILASPVNYTMLDATYEFPKFENMFRVIYSFQNQNWRVENYNMLPTNHDIEPTYPVRESSKYGRMYCSNPFVYTTRLVYNAFMNDLAFDYGYSDNSILIDAYYINQLYYIAKIWGKIITHDIGDGKNDYQVHSVIAEVIPRRHFTYQLDLIAGWNNYNYSITDSDRDPQLSLRLRDREYVSDIYDPESNIGDIVPANFTAKNNTNVKVPTGHNPFSVLQTPGITNTDESFNAADHVSRESMVLLTPIKTKFRRMKIEWLSDIGIKVKCFLIKVIEFSRRSQ